jgi:sortase A
VAASRSLRHGVSLVAISVLTSISALAVWCLLFGFGLSAVEEWGSQARLHDAFRARLAAQTLPTGGTIAHGLPVAEIRAPVAGAHDVVVVEGTSSRDLQAGPGHLPGSAVPGEAGTAVVFGRAQTYGAPFGEISRLHPGTTFTVIDVFGSLTFRVEGHRRPGDPLPAALPPSGARLTLVSATSSGLHSGWAPTKPIYVDAALVGKAQPVSGTPPKTISSADLVMHTDRDALGPLVEWLFALAVVATGLEWARARWGRWQTIIVGAPVVIAALWGATDAGMGLLPNVL